MIYIDLFIAFLKVSCFAFGGAYGAIPLIREVVLSYGWLTEEQLTYMIALSESTPGPIIINIATYVGSSQAGFLGAITATLAVVIPCFVIIILVTVVMKKILKNKYVQSVLKGMKPCIIGIVLATGIYMVVTNVVSFSTGVEFDIKNLVVTITLMIIMFFSKFVIKKQISAITLIGISAVIGAIIYGV